MMLEIFVSFLILFAAWSLGLFYFNNYKQASGCSSDHVWVLFCRFDSDSLIDQNRELVKQKLKSFPQVESCAFSDNNVPFSFSSTSWGWKYKNVQINSQVMQVDPDIINVMNLNMKAGKFFTNADKTNKYKPVVINEVMKKKLFGSEDAVGKILNENEEDNKSQVVGIVENFKFKSDYQEIEPCVMTFTNEWSKVCLIKVRADADVNFEAKLTRDLVRLGKSWSMEIQHMDNMRSNQNKLALIPILALFIVYSFLVFNVALGLFGVLFQTINRRKGEIGVRRAMGATKNDILGQFVGETLVIATFGLTLGVFFAIQFPLLQVLDNKVPWLMAILFAVISVYILIILCALLPSNQAAKIFPAVALHED